MSYTHRVAVTAYVIHENKFLMLKRNHDPKVWGPPGGRLHPDEDPEQGLRREIREECGLEIGILGVAGTWFGAIGPHHYLSIDYLAHSETENVKLSHEHSEYMWSTMHDLKNDTPKLGGASPSFVLEDFEKAWTLYNKLK
jgi:8-oxo-dGTP diphosphatase